MPKAIKLVESKKKAIAQTIPDYDVIFRGDKWGKLYFNMSGYVGYLPCPKSDGGCISLVIGEVALSTYRREIASLNLEWAALDAPPNDFQL